MTFRGDATGEVKLKSELSTVQTSFKKKQF